MTRLSRRPLSSILPLLLLAGLFLGACGSSGGNGTAPSAPSVRISATAPAPAPTARATARSTRLPQSVKYQC